LKISKIIHKKTTLIFTTKGIYEKFALSNEFLIYIKNGFKALKDKINSIEKSAGIYFDDNK
jgi:hypothetical protein